jgi:hypothetical protein
MLDRGLAVDLAAGLEIEQDLMTEANKEVRGEEVAQRRSAVQARGRNQVS